MLFVGEVGDPLPVDEVRARCRGTHGRLELVRGGTSLSAMNADFDFSEIVSVYGPRYTPEGKARRAAEAALQQGDAATAAAALAGLDRNQEDTAMLWLWIGQERSGAGDVPGAMEALAGLPMGLPGVSAAYVRILQGSAAKARAALASGQAAEGLAALKPVPVILAMGLPADAVSQGLRLDLDELMAQLMLATGDHDGAAVALERVVLADPGRGRAWLALGDARWQARDKKGARVA